MHTSGVGGIKAFVSKTLWRVGLGHANEMLAIQSVLLAPGTSGKMVDVGAHKGESCREFARRSWKVLAFEPDDDNRAALEVALGGCDNVSIDVRAVGETTGAEVLFYKSTLSTGISGLHPFHESHTASGHVKVVRLEDAIDEYQFGDSIDFLKVDAEGHDYFVLRSYPWSRSLPRVVLVEFENSKSEPLGYDFDILAQYLVDLGYHVLVSEWFPIERYGGRHKWRGASFYPCPLRDRRAWGNLIASQSREVLESIRDRIA